MAQKQVQRQKQTGQEQPQIEPLPTAAPNKSSLTSEIDSLLDEIDTVLEVNAAEFISSYVQKGGE